ncbi:metalloregulator ArsR/SmtB family transcription factor [Aquabacter sp. CN5-332]|uniref:ArsR/SmtB family transcription factor n=1 Tax=Aquabacter sp. CN5-332 TaxID=3156608 RepID=UPI0032B59101
MSLDRPQADASSLPYAALLDGLKAAGEDTRLRLLAILDQAELTVSELTDILGQSQPRISRHLKLLAEAGLVERHREASWVFYRCAGEGPGGAVARALLGLLDAGDPLIRRDRERLSEVRSAREAQAQAYFASHAERWDAIRSLHVPEALVEQQVRDALGDAPIDSFLDLGTGTGRMLEIFAPHIQRGVGVDLSPDMLGVARVNLERAGVRNCVVRHGDIYNLAMPRDSFDAIVVHQVLHFLDDGGRAVREAARLLRPGGRLLVVDFAPHDLEFLREAHAHRRLGFAEETVAGWMAQAGLEPELHRALTPEAAADGSLTVSIWLARDPRIAPAQDVENRDNREVA